MRLTPEASAALEDYRRDHAVYPSGNLLLLNEMLRLFPPGHDDPVTPERLLACGIDWGNRTPLRIESGMTLYYSQKNSLGKQENSWQHIPYLLTNMGAVLELMEELKHQTKTIEGKAEP